MGKSTGKTTKGGKTMNPTDAYRKELRKKELKRNKKERKKVREVGILKKDPETLKEQISKLEAMKADGALDKARKHKKRQLEDTLNLVLKKRKEYEEKMKEKGETPVMFSHLGPVRKNATVEEEERSNHPRPEDSVYYHPTLNPSGAPPPGKPQMFKSSIGPGMPLPEASSSNAASSSVAESEDTALPFTPSLPPPPPLPPSVLDPGDGVSLPVPPPPAIPSNPGMEVSVAGLPPPPPPPPGPPPKEFFAVHPPFPQPPIVYQSAPPGLAGIEKPLNHDDSTFRDSVQVQNLPPPPPPPISSYENRDKRHQDGSSSETTDQPHADDKDVSRVALPLSPPPPPSYQRPPLPLPGDIVNMHPDLLLPGCHRLPPPPPPPTDVRHVFPKPGMAGQPMPHVLGAMGVPMLMRPPFGPPPGYIIRPPLPPGPPPFHPDELIARPPMPPKPSYVKSAASTVVKRPLAQHTPELTAMIPASVRVRRESALPKPKLKSSNILPTSQPSVATSSVSSVKQEKSSSSVSKKPASIDDSYMAFLQDMKALGALDS